MEIPRDLRHAVGIASALVAPVHDANEIVAAVAVFSGSSSPPLDSEDEWMLHRIAGELPGMFREASPGARRPRGLSDVVQVLKARGVVQSVRELCSMLAVATKLAVKMSLAEAAAIRIVNEDTGELELVASSGDWQMLTAWPAISAARCRVIGARVSGAFCTGSPTSPSCPILRSHQVSEVSCIPLVPGAGVLGVLELWKPSASMLGVTGTRLVRAVGSVAGRALLEARMYPATGKARARAAFIERLSVASRTSSDPAHVAGESLAGLMQAVGFDIGAFADGYDGLEGPAAVLAFLVSSGARSPHAEADAGETAPGEPEAKTWSGLALRQAGPLSAGLHTMPVYLAGTRWPVGLVVPLVSGDRVVGSLVLGKTLGKRFSLDEIEFLEDVRRDLAVLWECFAYRVCLSAHRGAEALAERIAALEQLAVGAAHEIRNPLSVIKGHLQVIQLDPATPQETKERIARLFHQLDQINDTVEVFRQLAKPMPPELTLLSLTGLLEEVIESIEPQASSMGIKIVKCYSEDVPEIMADGGKLQQVFLNLCRNSIEAMTPNGGELRISTRTSTDRRTVEIEFRDTGQGMSNEVMSKIFRPYYTTKKHGMGLGLNISMQIVKQHGGTIRAESSPGAGATFTVVLPVDHIPA